MRSRAVLAVLSAVVVTVSGVGPGPALAMADQSRSGSATVQPNTPGESLDAEAGQRVAVRGERVLWGVSAEAPDEVFAVGEGDGSTRARRFDGHHWALDRLPKFDNGGFRAVTPVLQDGTAWAIGSTSGWTVAARWDGTTWKQAPTPPRERGETDHLISVAAAGPDDIWAVGYTTFELGYPPLPFALHWDGMEWSEVDIPLPVGHDSGILHGVTAISGDDVWAVGGSAGPLLVHWDGREWTPYTEPLDDSIHLRSIDAVASDDIWAVGSGPAREWGLLHWNGKKWRQVDAPEPDGDVAILFGVTALGPDDVWAVGGHDGERGEPGRAQTLHWNGNKWRRVKSPQPGADDNILYGVSGSGPNDVYAVGSFEDWDEPGNRHLIQHWDGDRWTRVHPKHD